MRPIHTIAGEHIGYSIGEGLFAVTGIQMGRVVDGSVYDRNGAYIGDIANGRMLRNKRKPHGTRPGFVPVRSRPLPRLPGLKPSPLPFGYEDFQPGLDLDVDDRR